MTGKTIILNGNKIIKDKVRKQFSYFIWIVLLNIGDYFDDKEIGDRIPILYLHDYYLSLIKEIGIASKLGEFPDSEQTENWKTFISFCNGITNALISIEYIVMNWHYLQTQFQMRTIFPSKARSDEPFFEIAVLADANRAKLMELAQRYRTSRH